VVCVKEPFYKDSAVTLEVADHGWGELRGQHVGDAWCCVDPLQPSPVCCNGATAFTREAFLKN
jgi:hypothetical protein